jgi:ribosomal protein S27AE
VGRQGKLQLLNMKKHSLEQKIYKQSPKGKIVQERYYHSIAKKRANLRYQTKHLREHCVYQKVYYAIKTGKLLRQPCKICGKPSAFAHHEDYNKPLVVKWLCNYHHSELHRERR